MNRYKLRQTIFTASVLLGLALLSLLLIPYMAANLDVEPSEPERLSVTETTVISGTFQGTVAITVPVPLGVLDFAFALSDEDGVLSGTMNNEYTLVFDGTPNLRGSVDTTPMTPTFTLASAPFSGEVSGREVERSFRLDGEAVENGEVLQAPCSTPLHSTLLYSTLLHSTPPARRAQFLSCGFQPRAPLHHTEGLHFTPSGGAR